jgi:hypothetical protein
MFVKAVKTILNSKSGDEYCRIFIAIRWKAQPGRSTISAIFINQGSFRYRNLSTNFVKTLLLLTIEIANISELSWWPS